MKILGKGLVLITGGAKSGKSRFAEGMVTADGRPRTYIATAEAWDDEMRAAVADHRADRGGDWTTVEAPRNLCRILDAADPNSVLLIDCATMWLTNLILAEADIEAETEALIQSLARCPAPVVIVTNELGWSIVPDNALARRFRNAQGRLNHRLAAEAGLVVAVISGLPLVLKGTL